MEWLPGLPLRKYLLMYYVTSGKFLTTWSIWRVKGCQTHSRYALCCSWLMNVCLHVVHCLLVSLEYHMVYLALKQQHLPLIFCFTAFLDSLHISCTASFFYSSAYLSDDNAPHISLSLFTVGTKPWPSEEDDIGTEQDSASFETDWGWCGWSFSDENRGEKG